MRLFKKKPTSNATLAELESYYGVKRGGNSTRGAMVKSAGLAAATVFVVAALVFVLFLAGRGIYRAATNDDKNETATTEQKEDEKRTPAPSGAGSTPSNTPPATKPSTPTTATPTPAPSTQTSNLPQTGPSDDL